jgi:hypothetical protein
MNEAEFAVEVTNILVHYFFEISFDIIIKSTLLVVNLNRFVKFNVLLDLQL